MASSSIRNTRGGFRREAILLAVVAALFVVSLIAFVYQQRAAGNNAEVEDEISSLSDMSRSLMASTDSIAQGRMPAFDDINALAAKIDHRTDALVNGDSADGLPKVPVYASSNANTVLTQWQTLKAGIQLFNQLRSPRELIGTSLQTIDGATPAAQDDYRQVAERLATRNAPAAQIYLVASQLIRLDHLTLDVKRQIAAGDDITGAAEKLADDTKTFLRVNADLLNAAGGDAALTGALNKAAESFASVPPAAAQIVGLTPAYLQLAASAKKISKVDGPALVADLSALRNGLAPSTFASWLPLITFSIAAVGIGLLSYYFWLTLRAAREQQKIAEARDAGQQIAILTLLDEIAGLADGDLTVSVPVTQEFTGALADSINYTVQTLRTLVGTINSTSAEVVAAAASTQNIARQMNEASERQARDITAVTTAINLTSQSLQEVATRAEQMSSQAADSVNTARTGVSTVGRTIQNMASLREQIQDTAKRIKRLGESSQEIGTIIEFINDIAEQTNTLALNASIQAAMAGDAGRGFAVVADEVQRLAERAGSATRQIESLVKTIQADTNEVIISMERSTANVVAGAKSAEEAGQALTQIETTSQDLSRLIQDISSAARHQSVESTKIAGTMTNIRQIAIQTSGSAQKTSQAVGELNSLSDKLRESVSGFKLTDEPTFEVAARV